MTLEEKIGVILDDCCMPIKLPDSNRGEATQAILELIKEERIDELLWSTGVEYKYDRDRQIVQNRIARLQAELEEK